MAVNDDVRREDERLQAYHDGELGWFARVRMERRVARSAELRERLAEFAALSGLVRESVRPPAAPDLWDGIARGLASVDAERADTAGSSALQTGFGWIFRPAGAFAAAAAAAIALAFVLVSSDTAPGGVVHWVDGGDRNVMVIDEEDDVTVIWVFDLKSDAASRGGRRGAA